MSTWRRLPSSPVWDLMLALFAVLNMIQIVHVLPSRVFKYDFNHYYISSRMLLEGSNPYRIPLARAAEKYGFEHGETIPIATNPPVLMWLLAPLALLSPTVAFWCWVTIQMAGLLLMLNGVQWLFRNRLSPRAWRLLCAALLASAPVFWHFVCSHVELVVALALVFAYTRHVQGKHTQACFTVLLAGLMKLYPFVLLPWFIWRTPGPGRRRIRLGLALLIAGTASVWLSGLGLWVDFFQYAGPVLRKWAVGNGHTLNALGPFTTTSFFCALGREVCRVCGWHEVDQLWMAGGVLAGLLSILAGYSFCARAGREEAIQFSILCVAMMIGGATTWGYYFVILLLPITVASIVSMESFSFGRMLALVLVLLALNTQGLKWMHFDSRWTLILLNYIPLYGLCGLYLQLMFFSARDKGQQALLEAR